MKNHSKGLAFPTVEKAIEELKDGKMILIVDDETRENEGDLAIAAEKVTADHINFMAKHGRGLICMPIIGNRLDSLKIPLMADGRGKGSKHSTAFTVSVDYLKNTSTGISAEDRARTVRGILDESSNPEDFAHGGHLFPLRYEEGGVLVRNGHTEAIVDLVMIAGLYPAGVICEVMNADGTMARRPDLKKFANDHDICTVSIKDITSYREQGEDPVAGIDDAELPTQDDNDPVVRVADAKLPTEHGEFSAVAYKTLVSDGEHLALIKGDISGDEPVLVRVHSECMTGEVFGSTRCDCGEQINLALSAISEEGRGVLVYMRQEGRGIGLHNKIKAYALQDSGLDTVEANIKLGFPPDLRYYGVAGEILMELGISKMKLLTNNPDKVVGLESCGIEIVERVPILGTTSPENVTYLKAKEAKLGHILEVGNNWKSGSDS